MVPSVRDRDLHFSICKSTLTPCTPTFAIDPPTATNSCACSNVAGIPTASITESNPCPSVSRSNLSLASAALVLTVCAPMARACSNRASSTSTITNFAGEYNCAVNRHPMPIGPAPIITTLPPGVTLPFNVPHSIPVGSTSDSIIAIRPGMPSGILCSDRFACGIRTYSACVPSTRLPNRHPPSSQCDTIPLWQNRQPPQHV